LTNSQTHQTEDLSSFQSKYADKLLWGVPLSDDVKSGLSGHYSIMVAAGRFLAKYSLDPEFRRLFLEDPSSFAIAHVKNSLLQEDLFIFTEGTDKKLYPLKGNVNKMQEGHLIAQHTPAKPESIQLMKPESLFKLMRILQETHPDLGYRNIGNMLLTAGYKGAALQIVEDDCVILHSNEESRTYRRVIDSLNLAVKKAEENIKEKGLSISREQLIDIAARSLTSFLSIARFNPELVQISEYQQEIKKAENDLPRLVPDPELTGRVEMKESRVEVRQESKHPGNERLE